MGIEAELEARRIPDAAEIRTLLEKYFVGAIDASQVAQIESRVREIATNLTRREVEDKTYHSNNVRYRGRAWREELSYGLTVPRVIDYVPWFATITNGFPPARPYCPDPFVGNWEETAAGSKWELAVDGTFRSDDTALAKHKAWYLVRNADAGYRGDQIHLKKGKYDDAQIFKVRSIDPSELVIGSFGGEDRTIQLRRTS